MTAILFDTEATGTEDNDEIIEAAWAYPELTKVHHVDAALGIDRMRVAVTHSAVAVERFCPTAPIKYGAMAVHHIIPEDLEGCRPSSEFRLPGGTQYIIGHKVDFDWKMAKHPLVKRICTLALSRKVWPGLDSHSQSALLYFLMESPDTARTILKNAHSASADVQILGVILDHLVGELEPTSWEHLHQISEEARIPTHMTFGKHKGDSIATLPGGYKDWMLRQTDMDPYVLIAVRRTMNAGGK